MASFFFRNLKNGFNIAKPALETLQLMLVPCQFYVAYDFIYGHKIKGFVEEHFRHTNCLIKDLPHQVQYLIEKKKKAAYPTVDMYLGGYKVVRVEYSRFKHAFNHTNNLLIDAVPLAVKVGSSHGFK